MKKCLLIAVCGVLFLTSCKKNSDVAPSNTITATIDGVNETFNSNITAKIGSSIQANSDLTITADNGTASGADGMSITINSNNAIAKGTYTNTGTSGFTSLFYSKGQFSLTSPNYWTTDVNGVNLTTITITSMSDKNIQGTFSGKLVLANGNTVKSVTDGKFNVNFQ